ncbi:hypothetical protein Hanom_Chr17g01555501 [Helianthus anomalus]
MTSKKETQTSLFIFFSKLELFVCDLSESEKDVSGDEIWNPATKRALTLLEV